MASNVLHAQQQLTPGTNFSEAFWDEKHKGVDIIMTRLRKSKDTCEEIKKLYELRANIEQDYGERLLKLASTSRLGEFEEDSFSETLSRIPSTLETTARAHIDLAQQLKDHLESPLDGFLKEQKDLRKMQQQQIENSKQLKNLHETDVARTKEYYSVECSKLISLENHYTSVLSNSTVDEPNQQEELAKIEKEIEEQRRMVTVADQVYKRSVDNYNLVNEQWVNNWAKSTEKFQEMEFKRITYLRSTLWSFANMMTSTFSIDEECCDRIRTALEITDVQKDLTQFVKKYGTGGKIPSPIAYEIITDKDNFKSLSAPVISQQRSENYAKLLSAPVIQEKVHTNPGEELKSVDRQLEKAAVAGDNEDHQQIFNAIKEVESILNQSNIEEGLINTPAPPLLINKTDDHLDGLKTFKVQSKRASYASNNQAIPPIMMAKSIEKNHSNIDNNDININNESHLAPNTTETTPNLTNGEEKEPPSKYKPMTNPAFDDHKLDVASIENKIAVAPVVDHQDEEEESDDESKEYHNRMHRPPPKDEKWVISSIRRPQQLPVRTLNAKMFDGTTTRSSSILSSPAPSNNENSTEIKDEQLQQLEEQHKPKVHKPAIPLTIDIPNSVKPTPELPQNVAQQIINEGRRLSQMSPIQQKSDLLYNQQQQQQSNTEDALGIRPAPWTEEIPTNERMIRDNNMNRNTMSSVPTNGGQNGYYAYQAPRGSSLKLSSANLQQHQQAQQQQQQFIKDNGKQYNESTVKSATKEKDGKGRFSLGFFGNKKEKKKEKEAAAAAAQANNNNLSQQPSYNHSDSHYQQPQPRPTSQPVHVYPQPLLQLQQQQQPLQQRQIQQQQSQEFIHSSDIKSNHTNNNMVNNPLPPPVQQSQQQSFDGNRFSGYAKAQWSFEATIDGEMSFHADEVVGIIRKQTDGWWEAERLQPNVAGQRGLVPGNYMVEST